MEPRFLEGTCHHLSFVELVYLPSVKVHTVLRVFVFCCADSAERDQWISNLQQLMLQFHDSSHLITADGTGEKVAESPREPITPKTPATWKSSRSTPADVFGSIAKKAAVKVAGGAFKGMASLRAIASGQRVPSKEAMLLMDSTRARRWGHRRRLVLNDRILTIAPKEVFESDIAQVLLEKALSLGDVPTAGDVASFLDATCLLKVPWTCFLVNMHQYASRDPKKGESLG